MLCYASFMIDNFRHHSSDWSQVPSPYPAATGVGYGLSASRIRTGTLSAEHIVLDPAGLLLFTTPSVSVGLTYVLWLFFGLFGVHYFYMGKPGVGVLYLLTGGLLGVGWFIDLFTIKGQVERLNRR